MKILLQALLLFSILLLSPVGQAGLRDIRPCLSQHNYEALQLNQLRKPLYAGLSSGQSQVVSDKLIWMERKLSLVVPFADAWAAPYQAAGIPILCQDFISMDETPLFTASNPEGKDSLHNFRPADVSQIKIRLLELLKAKNYEQLAEYADSQIQDLHRTPRYNCMVRHILESIRRMAALTPVHAKKAKAAGKLSTEFLSATILRSHIYILSESAEIDRLAAPLQAQGLLIVCQDVPYIPWP